MHLWPSIEGLQNVIKEANRTGRKNKQRYKGKIKLDGTNAGISISNGEVRFQSRSIYITPEKDNAGFARWASSIDWKSVKNGSSLPIMTIFGEWAGAGIQSGCSVKDIGLKAFFVFAIEYSSDEKDEETGKYVQSILEVEPAHLEKILNPVKDFVRVLPWYEGSEYEINFGEPDSSVIDQINSDVARIEMEDPYIKTVFGISGIGEGLVLYPLGLNNINDWENFAFKAKGMKHMVKKQEKPVQVMVDVSPSVESFVASFVTEARCNQGLNVVCGSSPPEKKNISAFLTWMSNDVKKESKDELEASNLSWEKVAGEVTKAARVWFLRKF